MSSETVLAEVNDIFRTVLENDEIVVGRESTQHDVPEWDSLNHIQLVVSIEKHFKLRFTAAEIQGFKNVGEMCDHISRKVSG